MITEVSGVKVGNLYQDIGGEKRGRGFRTVKVVEIKLKEPEGHYLAVIENTKTKRKVTVRIGRLMKKSRFFLMAKDQETAPEAPVAA